VALITLIRAIAHLRSRVPSGFLRSEFNQSRTYLRCSLSSDFGRPSIHLGSQVSLRGRISPEPVCERGGGTRVADFALLRENWSKSGEVLAEKRGIYFFKSQFQIPGFLIRQLSRSLSSLSGWLYVVEPLFTLTVTTGLCSLPRALAQ
jgi:hypothetical protein